MAALVRHGLFKTSLQLNTVTNLARSYVKKAKKPNPDKKRTPIIDSAAEYVAAKGFLRSQKSYEPPQDVADRFKIICRQVVGSENEPIKDINQRFTLLNACFKQFNHSVPNSLINSMVTTQDVLKFYQTPVNTTIPLDVMKNIDLPKNLHIQYEYNRFHPETDTMFNGVSAFPQSSTLVTGLTSRKKYRGYEVSQKWPYNT